MPSRRRSELIALMARCEALADDLDAGRASPELLLAHVEELRTCFDAHSRSDLPRVTSSHARRPCHDRLAVTITDELRVVIDRMRAHLFDEELELI